MVATGAERSGGVQQLRTVIPDVVDRAANRPKPQDVLASRPEQRSRIALALAQPRGPVRFLDDHRHAIMEVSHTLIGVGRDDGE